jgi:hypothetical protein
MDLLYSKPRSPVSCHSILFFQNTTFQVEEEELSVAHQTIERVFGYQLLYSAIKSEVI